MKTTSSFGRLLDLATDKFEKYLDEKEEISRTQTKTKTMNELIKTAFKDGVLSDAEKVTLFKKAEELGYDLDQLQMRLDNELERINFENDLKDRIKNISTANNSRRCPMCGSLVGTLETTCPECNYNFDGIAPSSSVKELMDIVFAIEAKFGKDKYATNLIQRTVGAQPINPHKTELFDWLVFAESRLSSSTMEKIYRDCYAGRDVFAMKFKEAYSKAYTLFPNDEAFQKFYSKKQSVMDEYNRKLKIIEDKIKLRKIYAGLEIILSVLLVIVSWVCLHWILAILLSAAIVYGAIYMVVLTYPNDMYVRDLKRSIIGE